MKGVPYNLRRFQEYEVIEGGRGNNSELEDWKILTKELYTMAFYMDENLVVDTGMINSVLISCASSKTAIALAYCLRMRQMRYVVGLTSQEHLDFVRSTGLYHEVFTYDECDQLPNDRTIVYMDFRCDGALRQKITQHMGTNLMYNMVLGPAVFQKSMKDQLFEKRAREILFDESKWRERRRMVAEVTKTGRNEQLKYSYTAFVERARSWINLKHLGGTDAFASVYQKVFENGAPRDEGYICSMHDDEFVVEEIWDA